jgi:hypothetical protein
LHASLLKRAALEGESVRGDVTIPIGLVSARERTLRNLCRFGADFARVLERMRKGPTDAQLCGRTQSRPRQN